MIIVMIIRISQVVPNVVPITSNGEVSNLHVWTPSIMKFDAKVAITPIPIIFENFILNCSLMSAKTSLNLVCCDDQIVIETITPPRTIVWPTNPGNLAIDSGMNVVSEFSCFSNNDESIFTSPTPNTMAACTRWPSIFDRTLLVIV